MNVPIYEQETVIQISRDSDKMNIWTSDSTMMTRLDKLCEKSNRWVCTSVGKIEGDVVNKEICRRQGTSFSDSQHKKNEAFDRGAESTEKGTS